MITLTKTKETSEESRKFEYSIVFSGQIVSKLGEFSGSDAEGQNTLEVCCTYIYIIENAPVVWVSFRPLSRLPSCRHMVQKFSVDLQRFSLKFQTHFVHTCAM